MSFISDFQPLQPTQQGLSSAIDDQIRLVKGILLSVFPNLNLAVNLSAAEFNLIVGGLQEIPTGTKILFYQATPPPGWTIFDALTLGAGVQFYIRINAATGLGINPTSPLYITNYPVWTGNVDNTMLNITQIPNHTHGYDSIIGSSDGTGNLAWYSVTAGSTGRVFSPKAPTNLTGGGVGHSHSVDVAPGNTMKYIDCIIGVKS